MSVAVLADNDELNNVVKADDDGACHDPDLSPVASASSSECNVGESSTEDEADLSPDSGDESNRYSNPDEDVFNDAAVAQGVRISCGDEEDDIGCEDHFEELNSFAMASQGNIHTLALFPRPGFGNTGYNLLVATLSRQVYTMGFVEYDPQKRKMEDLRFKREMSAEPPPRLVDCGRYYPPRVYWLDPICEPVRREHRFAYVPSTAEVLALDVFSRQEDRNSLVVGCVLRQSSHFYLNVYSDPLDASNIGSLSQCAQTLELGFIPTRVLHAYVPYQVPKGCVNNAFMVFGMDDRIHTYMERGGLKFEAVSTERIFPEFGDEHSSYPTAVDIAYLDPRSEYRISVLCTEDGRIRAKLVKVRDAGMGDGERSLHPIAVHEWETTCGAGTAFAAKIFQTRGRDLNAGSLERGLTGTRSVYIKNVHDEDWQGLHNEVEYEEEGPESKVGDDYYSDIKIETLPRVNILVVNDTAPSIVYMDVIHNGLDKARVLRQSSQFDVATCGEAADVNLDGELEVAIGTAGQALIVYKWNERADEWLLQFMRWMDDPVHAIRSVDLTGDGLQELVVQTTKAICVLRHNMEFVRRVQKEKLVQHFLSPPAVARRRKLREEQKKASWFIEEIDGDDAPERPVPPQERMTLRPESYRSDLPETGLVELYRDNSAELFGGGGDASRRKSFRDLGTGTIPQNNKADDKPDIRVTLEMVDVAEKNVDEYAGEQN